MDDIENRLQELRSKSADASRKHAQVEARLDQVRARKQEILDTLAEQGFEDPAQARVRVEELDSEVAEVLTEIEEKVQSV